MPQPGIKGWYPKVVHDGPHFRCKVDYDRNTMETTRTWVWEEGQVWSADWHLRIPKAKSAGEKYPVVPPPVAPSSVALFAPARGDHLTESPIAGPKVTPEIGTRYCQHIHAYVPEHLPYKVGRLAPAQKAPLRERLLTREFWHLPVAGEDSGDDEADELESSVRIEIKIVPARDGTSVLAEGLTHHQAPLIPVQQAQKDQAIKYRSLTTARPDLVQRSAAQQSNAIKYRGVNPYV